MPAGAALVGSGTGNEPHHGESRSTLRAEEELSFPFQIRDRSALWLLPHALGPGRDCEKLLTAQVEGELLAPMFVLAGAVTMPMHHEQRLSVVDFLGNNSLSLIDTKYVRLSVTHYPVTSDLSIFQDLIIALRWTTTFLNFFHYKANGIVAK